MLSQDSPLAFKSNLADLWKHNALSDHSVRTNYIFLVLRMGTGLSWFCLFGSVSGGFNLWKYDVAISLTELIESFWLKKNCHERLINPIFHANSRQFSTFRFFLGSTTCPEWTDWVFQILSLNQRKEKRFFQKCCVLKMHSCSSWNSSVYNL